MSDNQGDDHRGGTGDDVANALDGFLGRFRHRVHPVRLLVALSGGSDSLGLLIGLHERLARPPVDPSTPLILIAATVDHGLRPEAAGESLRMAALCARLGIDHVGLRWDGPKPATGLMAAARIARYHLLADAAVAMGCALLVTGHTADDQAETIAMRRARQAKDDALGLAGMADAVLFDNRLWIERPLLACRRQSLRDALARRGMAWIEDPSNGDLRFERARLRAETAGEPRVAAPFPDRAALSQRAAELLGAIASQPLPGLVHLALPKADRNQAGPDRTGDRRALQHLLALLLATVGGCSHGPGSQAMARAMALVDGPAGARLTLGRCLIHRGRDGLHLVRERRNLPAPMLIGPGERLIWDGRFAIDNRGDSPVRISPEGRPGTMVPLPPSGDRGDGIPASLAGLACAGLPALQGQRPWEVVTSAAVNRWIAPYSLFLPGFDLPLARALADFFAAAPPLARPFAV